MNQSPESGFGSGKMDEELTFGQKIKRANANRRLAREPKKAADR